MADPDRYVLETLRGIEQAAGVMSVPVQSVEASQLRGLRGQLEAFTDYIDYRFALGEITGFMGTADAEMLTMDRVPFGLPPNTTKTAARGMRLFGLYGHGLSLPLRRFIDTNDSGVDRLNTKIQPHDAVQYFRERPALLATERAELDFQTFIRGAANKAILAELKGAEHHDDKFQHADDLAHALMFNARISKNPYTTYVMQKMFARYNSQALQEAIIQARSVIHVGRIVAGLPVV